MKTRRAALRGLHAALITAMTLAGCATPSTRGTDNRGESPGPGNRAFAAFTITKSGGVAGIRQRIDVGADGPVRNESGQDVGHLDTADLAELRGLLTGREIRDEAGLKQPRRSQCADGFTFILVMGDLHVSDYACGRPANKPAFNRVPELTSASHIKE